MASHGCRQLMEENNLYLIKLSEIIHVLKEAKTRRRLYRKHQNEAAVIVRPHNEKIITYNVTTETFMGKV